ncbi:MAG: hypothetical protein QNJ55_24405 [Xenococcus sp. MO_188.B8]|nr:hypothetical protein [Xenococcus sp. MO_188.B8]
MIEPLKSHSPRWQNKVTDMRNWLDFSVTKRDRQIVLDKNRDQSLTN